MTEQAERYDRIAEGYERWWAPVLAPSARALLPHLDAAVAAGARGIVSAGTGAGRPTPGEDAAFDRAGAQGVLICQGSRVGSGRSLRSPGLRKRGFVAADNLQPWKARLLLALGLNLTSDPDVIQGYFDTY